MIKVIAEIGSNFTPGNLDSALDMIRIAVECGADIVKFQLYRVDNMDRPQEWRERCRPWELFARWQAELSAMATECNVGYLCSVFSSALVETWLAEYNAIKIASSEIGNQRLLSTINTSQVRFLPGESWITNVYMSVPPDKHPALIPALTWLNNCRVTLFHCIPEYPAKDPQLDSITELLKLGLPVGWSSHVTYPEAVDVAREAVDLGATVVEAHLRDFDTPENAPDNGPWALYPDEFVELVKEVKK